jgi:hypothetical protein
VARRIVHAAAYCDSEVGRSLGEGCVARYGLPRPFGRARVLVTACDAIADAVANRVHQRLTLRGLAEKGGRGIRKAIGLSVPAAAGANPGCLPIRTAKIVEAVLATVSIIQLHRRFRRSSA